MIEVTWILAACLVGTLVYWAMYLLKPKYAGLNIPPSPGPKRFPFGHLHLWGKKPNMGTIESFRAKVGDIYSLDLAGRLMVIVSGYDNLKEVLVNHWNETADRPYTFIHQKPFLNEINRGVITGRGDNWKAQRTATIVILRAFGMGKNLMEKKINEEVNIFVKKLGSQNSQPVDFRNLINISISNIICSMIVGKRFDHDDPHFVKLINDINSSFEKVPNTPLLTLFPFLRHVPFDPLGVRAWMKHVLAVRNEFSLRHINEEKKTFDKTKTPENFITAYFQKMLEEAAEGGKKYLDEENLIANIRTLFIAGTETTSTTIYWCVLICLHHPEVQEKVFKEITTHVGEERLPTINDRPQLRYLDAVIRETQRFASLVPLMARDVAENFEFKGYTIPKGCLLMVNFLSALHDPNPWGDPEKFRPERFFDADGNLTKPEEFIPFGLGRRVCLGEALAKMELFLFLATIFQRFRFEPEDPSGELPPLKGQLQIVLVPKPYKVKFVPRSR